MGLGSKAKGLGPLPTVGWLAVWIFSSVEPMFFKEDCGEVAKEECGDATWTGDCGAVRAAPLAPAGMRLPPLGVVGRGLASGLPPAAGFRPFSPARVLGLSNIESVLLVTLMV